MRLDAGAVTPLNTQQNNDGDNLLLFAAAILIDVTCQFFFSESFFFLIDLKLLTSLLRKNAIGVVFENFIQI